MRLRPVGDAALTCELGAAGDARVRARVRALGRSLAADPLPGQRECVPALASLLLVFDARGTTAERVGLQLQDRLDHAPPASPPRTHEIPATYGGEAGPDLPEVARRLGLTPDEVVALHARTEYEVELLGFMPGFAYLGPLPAALELPRRATPRTRLPRGSIAIAGRQTGVYPAASPGGWHVLGRTAAVLFDAARRPPALLQPGDRVRFRPVAELAAAEPVEERRPATPEPAVEVLEPGLLTTVQDLGRFGWRSQGVAWAGALDPGALAGANAAVGNAPGAAGLEITLQGPRLVFLKALRFALAGADLSAVLERRDLGAWPVPRGVPVQARPGNVLRFGEPRRGCRAYLALAGGVDAPPVLGSRSSDVKAGLGLPPLRAGDRLGVGDGSGAGDEAPPPAPLDDEAVLRVVPGPQDEAFAPEDLAAFLCSAWTLGHESDRFGARLDGPRLEPLGPGEIASDGLVPGCVQVPPDGRPIVALAEGPTTGGYPKIATVVAADVARLAQLVPGRGRLRFELAGR